MSHGKTKGDHIDDVVYTLIYPGVIGSMVFDLLDPLRYSESSPDSLLPDHLADWSLLLGRLFLLCSFVVDYIHLRVILRPVAKTRTDHLLDLGIAATFCFAYFALGRASVAVSSEDLSHLLTKFCTFGHGFLAVSFILIFVYKDHIAKKSAAYLFSKALPAVAAGGLTFWFCYLWYHMDSGEEAIREQLEFIPVGVAIGQFVIFGLYLAFVYKEMWPQRAQPTAQENLPEH